MLSVAARALNFFVNSPWRAIVFKTVDMVFKENEADFSWAARVLNPSTEKASSETANDGRDV